MNERKKKMARLTKLSLLLTTLTLLSLSFISLPVNAVSTTVGGNDNWSRYPFGSDPGNVSATFPDFVAGGVYQQVYSKTAFSGPVTITQIAFASKSQNTSGPGTATYNFNLALSTTQAAPGALSTNLPANRGTGITQVFSGQYTTTITASDQFDMVIDITPFTYDPAQGNLLMEITFNAPKQFTGGPVLYFVAGSNSNIGRAANPSGTAGGAFSDGTFGLLTRFTTKGAAQVTLGNLAQTFDGTPKSAAVTTSPAGLPVVVTYDGSATPPINAGIYAVVATVNDPDFTGQANGNLVISKANQQIIFDSLPARTFGDADFSIGATSSSNLAVSFSASGDCTLSGAQVHLTRAGTCTIDATQPGDANHNAATPVSRTFTISKATATITLESLSQIFDGTPKSANATTNPAGLSVTLTYSQSGLPIAAPTNAGSYDVIASVTDANYKGGTSGTLVIGKATPVITWQNPQDITYGTALSATQLNAAASVTGALSYTPVAGTVLHAGTAQALQVSFTPDDSLNYESVSSSVSLDVLKATLTVRAEDNTRTFGQPNPPLTFSITGFVGGDTQAGSITGQPALSTTAVLNSDAGNYPITASIGTLLSNDYSFSFVDGTLTVAKAEQAIMFGPLSNKRFGDAAFQVKAEGEATGGAISFSSRTPAVCSVAGDIVSLLSAGTCTIRASQSASNNHNAAADVEQSFSVEKALTTTTLTSSPNPSALGQAVNFTAKVTSEAGTPTGTVQFIIDGVNQGRPRALNQQGIASGSTSDLTAGNHVVVAEYNGDANFALSSGALAADQTVNVAGSVTINDISLTEGDAGTKSFDFTVTLSEPSNLEVKVDFTTADATATAGSDYTAQTGTLTFAPGELTKTITVVVNGDTANEPDEQFKVNLSNAQNVNITDGEALGTITNDDAPLVQFSANTYQVNEADTNTAQGFASLDVEVVRTGDTSEPATVKYSTSDLSQGAECDVVNGQANQRCDYLLVNATLRFAAGENSKSISIPIINDGYGEGPESFTIHLKDAVGVGIGETDEAAITINDSGVVTTPATNPYLNNAFFVRMNYLDFLGRDADQAGFTDWNNLLNNCGPEKGFLGAPFNCDRTQVSHGFFASPEFTDKGFLIYRFYEVGMGRLPRYSEFIPDMSTLSGFGIPESVQQQNLRDYTQQFSSRTEFTSRFNDSLLASQAETLIQKLEQTAGVNLPATATTTPGQPTQYGRDELIRKRASGEFTVADTLKAFVEQQPVYDRFFPRGAVTMQYFANLRRDPDLNDPNLLGWNDWVEVFTNGKPSAGIAPRDIHHLIFGFIYSTEYRKRFGAP
jgi:hypothetical protein